MSVERCPECGLTIGECNFHAVDRLQEKDAQRFARTIEALTSGLTRVTAERNDLRIAAIGIRDDLLMRAKWDNDAKVVCAGNGAWLRLNEALGGEQHD